MSTSGFQWVPWDSVLTLSGNRKHACLGHMTGCQGNIVRWWQTSILCKSLAYTYISINTIHIKHALYIYYLHLICHIGNPVQHSNHSINYRMQLLTKHRKLSQWCWPWCIPTGVHTTGNNRKMHTNSTIWRQAETTAEGRTQTYTWSRTRKSTWSIFQREIDIPSNIHGRKWSSTPCVGWAAPQLPLPSTFSLEDNAPC